MTYFDALDDWRLLVVSGQDRASFLQGQLTQEIARARSDATCLAGYADAKGRLLWAGHLFAREDSLCLLVPAVSAEALASRLRLFVLRARVSITPGELALFGAAGAAPGELPEVPGWQALQLAGDAGRRLLVAPRSGPAATPPPPAVATIPSDDWRLRDIRAGIPSIMRETSGEFVPQMVNLDLLDGISFAKGCYTGQEIVARTRYLGRVKRRMLRFACSGPPPPPGTPVHGARDGVGQVVSAAVTAQGSEMLAVVQIEEAGVPLFADSTRLIGLERLPLPYEVPEAP